MFERFTESAIKVIMLAQEEARRMGHNYVGSEQLLLGLLGEGTGIAALTLRSHKVTLKDARVEVQRIIGSGPGQFTVEMPFSSGGKRALEYSWEEAKQMGVKYIGTEHLLLGIVRGEENHAVALLEKLGVSASAIRPAVIGMLDQASGMARQANLTTPQVDNLSDDVLRTLIVAREETRRLGHKAVSVELLLLGLIGEENGPAAETLRRCGVTIDNARWETEKIIGRGSGVIFVDSPFSELTQEVLNVGATIAQEAGHQSTTGEHLLLAILEMKCAGTEAILKNLNVDVIEMRTKSIYGLARINPYLTSIFYATKDAEIEGVLAKIMKPVQRKLANIANRPVSPAGVAKRFERFTESATKVMMLAQEEARELGHNCVGTEQILLGLIREKHSIGALALESQGISLDTARSEVVKIIGRGSGVVGVEIPFTPRAKRMLECADAEAKKLGSTFVGSAHLLLGLLAEGEGVAVRVLENLGVDLLVLQTKVLELIESGGFATA
jgi:ATP-dependent Clp protease ATP-binding subunit ClpA